MQTQESKNLRIELLEIDILDLILRIMDSLQMSRGFHIRGNLQVF